MFGFLKRRKTPAAPKAFPCLTNEDFYVDVEDNWVIITIKENLSVFKGDSIRVEINIDPIKLIDGRIYGDSKVFKGQE